MRIQEQVTKAHLPTPVHLKKLEYDTIQTQTQQCKPISASPVTSKQAPVSGIRNRSLDVVFGAIASSPVSMKRKVVDLTEDD